MIKMVGKEVESSDNDFCLLWSMWWIVRELERLHRLMVFPCGEEHSWIQTMHMWSTFFGKIILILVWWQVSLLPFV
jgi:hypothetical protein